MTAERYYALEKRDRLVISRDGMGLRVTVQLFGNQRSYGIQSYMEPFEILQPGFQFALCRRIQECFIRIAKAQIDDRRAR